MASVLIPGTTEVELLMFLDGEGIENTLYFEKAGAWTPAELTALGTALIAWWEEFYSLSMSNALILNGVKLTDWTSLTGAQVTVDATGSPTGQQGMEPMSNNVAPCISLRTASRGRSQRGRNYLSGVPTDAVTNSRVNANFITDMEAAYNELLNVATAQACTWVVASRYSGVTLVNGKKRAIPRAVGQTTPIISASFTDNVVDSQRGRLPNH